LLAVSPNPDTFRITDPVDQEICRVLHHRKDPPVYSQLYPWSVEWGMNYDEYAARVVTRSIKLLS
jgi:hypothetical protein